MEFRALASLMLQIWQSDVTVVDAVLLSSDDRVAKPTSGSADWKRETLPTLRPVVALEFHGVRGWSCLKIPLREAGIMVVSVLMGVVGVEKY